MRESNNATKIYYTLILAKGREAIQIRSKNLLWIEGKINKLGGTEYTIRPTLMQHLFCEIQHITLKK